MWSGTNFLDKYMHVFPTPLSFCLGKIRECAKRVKSWKNIVTQYFNYFFSKRISINGSIFWWGGGGVPCWWRNHRRWLRKRVSLVHADAQGLQFESCVGPAGWTVSYISKKVKIFWNKLKAFRSHFCQKYVWNIWTVRLSAGATSQQDAQRCFWMALFHCILTELPWTLHARRKES